jgi:hypothetical protein
MTQMGLTMAQYLEERGEARGEARGVRHSLEIVLETRFGTLSEEMRAAIDEADLDVVTAWLRAASTASSLAEVGIPMTDLPN